MRYSLALAESPSKTFILRSMTMITAELGIIFLLGTLGIGSHIIHQRAYTTLYRRLRQRSLVDISFRPSWASRVGAYACMGYLDRINRQIESSLLSDGDQALMRKIKLTYCVGVVTSFIAVCFLFSVRTQ